VATALLVKATVGQSLGSSSHFYASADSDIIHCLTLTATLIPATLLNAHTIRCSIAYYLHCKTG